MPTSWSCARERADLGFASFSSSSDGSMLPPPIPCLLQGSPHFPLTLPPLMTLPPPSSASATAVAAWLARQPPSPLLPPQLDLLLRLSPTPHCQAPPRLPRPPPILRASPPMPTPHPPWPPWPGEADAAWIWIVDRHTAAENLTNSYLFLFVLTNTLFVRYLSAICFRLATWQKGGRACQIANKCYLFAICPPGLSSRTNCKQIATR